MKGELAHFTGAFYLTGESGMSGASSRGFLKSMTVPVWTAAFPFPEESGLFIFRTECAKLPAPPACVTTLSLEIEAAARGTGYCLASDIKF